MACNGPINTGRADGNARFSSKSFVRQCMHDAAEAISHGNRIHTSGQPLSAACCRGNLLQQPVKALRGAVGTSGAGRLSTFSILSLCRVQAMTGPVRAHRFRPNTAGWKVSAQLFKMRQSPHVGTAKCNDAPTWLPRPSDS